jgi:hypothetical protein
MLEIIAEEPRQVNLAHLVPGASLDGAPEIILSPVDTWKASQATLLTALHTCEGRSQNRCSCTPTVQDLTNAWICVTILVQTCVLQGGETKL